MKKSFFVRGSICSSFAVHDAEDVLNEKGQKLLLFSLFILEMIVSCLPYGISISLNESATKTTKHLQGQGLIQENSVEMYQKFIIVKFTIIEIAFALSLSTMENMENTEF